jgi:hypothetical protein
MTSYVKHFALTTTLIGFLGLGGAACSETGDPSDSNEVDTGVGPKGVALESSPSFATGGIPADMFNVVRAETAKYFAEETILSGGNTMRHERMGIDLDNQTVIRSNFDLIYSYGVFDVSGGLTIRVPEYDLYQSVQIFDENHVTLAAVYPGEEFVLGPDDATYGEHLYLFMRTQRRTPDDAGTAELNARQDAVEIEVGSTKPYVSEDLYDPESFNALRQSLLERVAAGEAKSELGFVSDLNKIVFPHYQLVSIAGWAGQPATEAFYILLSGGDEAATQGKCSSMTFSAPDLQYERNGYWSITLYDAEGWVATDPFNTNSLRAKPNSDGTYTIHFNCSADRINNLEVVPNWNGLLRLYLPTSVESAISFRETLYRDHAITAVE